MKLEKVIPLDVVLERTVDLIEFCENERKTRNLPEIGYEVGTEETTGGLHRLKSMKPFIFTVGGRYMETLERFNYN